jgi:D-xylose transport system permease protein
MAKFVVEYEVNMWLAIAIGVAFGALVGTIIGLWRTRFDVPSFVVTLGASLILTGMQLFLLPQSGRYNLLNTGIDKIADTYVTGVTSLLVVIVPVIAYGFLFITSYRRKVSNGIAASLVKDVILPIGMIVIGGLFLLWLAAGYRGVPMPVIIFGVMLAVAGYFVSETGFGVHLYAIGGNEEAALRSGIKVRRVKVMSFAIAGSMAAIAGIIAASRILGVSVSSGGGAGGGTLLLEAIAAAVIGGVSLFGGRGNVIAALLGALIIGTVSNGLNLMGVDAQVKYIVTGLLLVLAVTLDRLIEKWTSSGGR